MKIIWDYMLLDDADVAFVYFVNFTVDNKIISADITLPTCAVCTFWEVITNNN